MANTIRLKFLVQPLTIVQITTVLLNFLHATNGAKILFVIGASSHSHRVAMQPLATRLAEIGHEVTFLSPIKPEVENPNITEFCPQALLEFNEKLNRDFSNEPVLGRLKDKHSDPFFAGTGELVWEMCQMANEATIKSPDFIKWVESTKFDLIIKETLGNEFALGIAHKHGAKVIGFCPHPVFPIDSDTYGFPTESASFPGWWLGGPYSIIPSHFHSEFKQLRWYLHYKWMHLPKVDAVLKEVFTKDLPPVEDLVKNIDLFMVNTHFSSEYARSLPPFIVQIGGMHVQESKSKTPLPKTISDFIDTDGTDGFIFISLGSVAQISGLPSETQKSLFDAIASFKNAKFLIKWNDKIPDYLPSNVLAMKWFPQQDLLAHPKCRGFISQGGLMSFQQATYHGVPVVIAPIFGDQPYNSEVAVHQGNGIHLELADFTFDKLSDAIRQLLYSESLSAKAKEVSRRFRDRPMSPLDTAVWWTEYVLRHNDTTHLKPLGINQEWWQRRLLDFWAVVFAGIFSLNLILFLCIRSLIRCFTKSSVKSMDKLKKQ